MKVSEELFGDLAGYKWTLYTATSCPRDSPGPWGSPREPTFWGCSQRANGTSHSTQKFHHAPLQRDRDERIALAKSVKKLQVRSQIAICPPMPSLICRTGLLIFYPFPLSPAGTAPGCTDGVQQPHTNFFIFSFPGSKQQKPQQFTWPLTKISKQRTGSKGAAQP